MYRAYYNENDPFNVWWLRTLIGCGLIAFGDVDDRSIEDVKPNDLVGYSQCHFFAGIGGWSRALRLYGWPDARPIWSMSCPCQPFSTAGKGGGFADERHLWPAAHWLIAARRPLTIVGEQVASPDGLKWFDLISDDLEGTAYTSGAVDLCAAGIGAPHIRQRLYWRADSEHSRVRWTSEPRETQGRRAFSETSGSRNSGISADSASSQYNESIEQSEVDPWHQTRLLLSGANEQAGVSADSNGRFASDRELQRSWEQRLQPEDNVACESFISRLEGYSGNVSNGGKPGWLSEDETRSIAKTGATRGFWGNCDWWHGRDEKYRPIEPGLFPLANGVSNRMGKLRGYGNAIIPQLAAEFIKATEEK